MNTLRLVVTSLGAIVVDEPAALVVRAEDASGRFGVLPGHADFLTALEIGVVSWRTPEGTAYCAVRGGILAVENGRRVAVATREAIADSDLEKLEPTVLREFRQRDEAERAARTEATRMELRAAREILRYLRPAQRIR